MSVASGKRYLEETRVKVQEGQRTRTEARVLQLRVTVLESRIEALEKLTGHLKTKHSSRCLTFVSSYLIPSLLLYIFLFSAYYVFASPLQSPAL